MFPSLKLSRVYPGPSPEVTHFRAAVDEVTPTHVIVVDSAGNVGVAKYDVFQGAVKSVAGRTGAVTLTHNDITDWNQFQYVLPVATDTHLGGVKIGAGIRETSDGKISTEPYEFAQNIPLPVWTVNHNLGYKPNSIEVEVSGEIVWTRHDHIDDNTFTVSFQANNSGKVRYR